MSYVLDTNILVAVLNGDPQVVRCLNSLAAGEALIPAMALGELRYGALSSSRVSENLARIDRILDFLVFVPIDQPLIERFGRIKASLRHRGITKSDADLLIAATALQVDGVLVSDDRALLDGSIEGLRAENWLALDPDSGGGSSLR